MSLREFQTALGRMVRNTARVAVAVGTCVDEPNGTTSADGSDGADPLWSLQLDTQERECLEALRPTAAFQFTRAVQRSWCEQRAANAASLTLSVLPDDMRRGVLEKWVDSGGGTLSFFGAEADALLDFIAEQLLDPSTELYICRLEQITLRASIQATCFQAPDLALFDLWRPVRRARHAGMVTTLLIAPGLDGVQRVASPEEQLLWERLTVPATAATLLQEGYWRDSIETLLQIGALEYGC
jgi:hypothetical protein